MHMPSRLNVAACAEYIRCFLSAVKIGQEKFRVVLICGYAFLKTRVNFLML